jgi:hypothetical protein
MKIKLLISSLLMAGALMGSGTASAIPFTIASGTLSQWVAASGLTLGLGVTQAAGDITYANHVEATINPSTYLSGDLKTLAGAADYITLAFSEVTPNLYAMIYTFMTTPNPSSATTVSPFFVNGGGYTTNGGDIEYTLKSLNANLFNAVKLDSTVAINPAVISTVNKDVYDFSGGSLLAALLSKSGAPDPLSSFAPFTPSQSIFVRDTYNATGGIIASSQNQFTTIPEPMTLIMLGIGLLGFGYSRRHILSDVKGLIA